MERRSANPLLRRAPTMEDVARQAGVSRALVSLVMRDRPNVSEERRLRVHEAAARLGYRPNAMARSLASQRTRTVGVILDDLSNPFFAEIAGGIEEVASRLGYQLLLGAGGRQARRERAALATLLEYRVDGIILVSPRMRTAEIAAAASEVPLVVVGRGVRGLDADCVLIDETHGTELVLGHLVELGHTEIVHVDGGSGAGGPQRRVAYLRGMRARRLRRRERVIPGDFTEDAGVSAAGLMLNEQQLPTAVFAANDLVAAGLLSGFDRAGVDVPGEVSIVGYDNISISHLAHVSLTTVDQPRAEMGGLALELLLDRIDNHRPKVARLIEPTLVVRSTTAPPRQATAPAA
ncbi:MAG: LacI family DNA-binding transcriptional regulator [Solirubrobacteraceae bacterium]